MLGWKPCLVGVMGLLLGCQVPAPTAQQQRGSLRIAVQFPKKNFATQLIRPETRVIYVAIYSQRQPGAQPLVFGPITPRNARVSLNQLAAGEQTVLAAAYDGQRRILTAGHSLSFVKPSSVTQVSLELGEAYSTQMKPADVEMLRQLKVELPPEDAPQPEVLEPVTDRDDGDEGKRASVSAAPETQPAEAPPAPASAEPAVQAAPVTTEPSPLTPPQRKSGGGGGRSGGSSQIPDDGLDSRVNVIDGSDDLDPVIVSSGGPES